MFLLKATHTNKNKKLADDPAVRKKKNTIFFLDRAPVLSVVQKESERQLDSVRIEKRQNNGALCSLGEQKL
eukprot:m.267700 g.267700  ORF g.267700 m.267700 type:complete len:71 (+) comp33983_c0_seq1:449-661(+)